jgi:hypothetical protein
MSDLYPCNCCKEPFCLGSKGCPAIENERDFIIRCKELIDKEIPAERKTKRFRSVLEDINSLTLEERAILSTQIGL